MPIVRKEDIKPYLEITLEEFLDKYDLTLEIFKKGEFGEIWYEGRIVDLFEIAPSLYGWRAYPITSAAYGRADTEARCLNQVITKINDTSKCNVLEIIKDHNEDVPLKDQKNRQELDVNVKLQLVEEE